MRAVAGIAIVLVLSLGGTPFAFAAAIDTSYPYAWSENVGWINFAPPSGDVEVTDTGLTGYAWSGNDGWISLHPSDETYVHNDGGGNLSGYAWGENLGYIDFAGVSIDADGFFHGYASSTAAGRISFNCGNTGSCAAADFKVRTFWSTDMEAVPHSSGRGGSPFFPNAPVLSPERSSGAALTAYGPVSGSLASATPRFAEGGTRLAPQTLFDIGVLPLVSSPSFIIPAFALGGIALAFFFFALRRSRKRES